MHLYSSRGACARKCDSMVSFACVVFALFLQVFSASSSSSTNPDDSSESCPVVFMDFLDLPNPALGPPAAFTAPSFWQQHLVTHIRHLLAVLQTKHTREQHSNNIAGKYEAFGLVVLHQQDIYVTRLTASAGYLVALKEQRPQHRAHTGNVTGATLSLSRWKLNFALASHRRALAQFIAMLL